MYLQSLKNSGDELFLKSYALENSEYMKNSIAFKFTNSCQNFMKLIS